MDCCRERETHTHTGLRDMWPTEGVGVREREREGEIQQHYRRSVYVPAVQCRCALHCRRLVIGQQNGYPIALPGNTHTHTHTHYSKLHQYTKRGNASIPSSGSWSGRGYHIERVIHIYLYIYIYNTYIIL